MIWRYLIGMYMISTTGCANLPTNTHIHHMGHKKSVSMTAFPKGKSV